MLHVAGLQGEQFKFEQKTEGSVRSLEDNIALRKVLLLIFSFCVWEPQFTSQRSVRETEKRFDNCGS
jgi:hypothetical protein